MNNTTYNMDGIKILGSILWSHMPTYEKDIIEQRINVNGQLRKINTGDTDIWNSNSISFLEKRNIIIR